MLKINLNLLLIFLIASSSYASTKVAIITPTDSEKKNTVGNEVNCGILGGLNASGVKSIDIKQFNNQRDPLKTASISKKIVKDNFDLVLGTTLSSQAIVASKVLGKSKIPLFVPLATNPQVTASSELTIRLPFSDKLQAKHLAKFAIEELKSKRILIVENKSIPYSTFLVERFIKLIGKNVNIVRASYITGQLNSKKIIEKYITSKMDLIFGPIYSVDMAKIYKAAAKTKYNFKILGADAVGGRKNFFDIIGQQSENVDLVFVKQTSGKIEGSLSKVFKRNMTNICPGYNITMNMAAGFDVGYITGHTIQSLGSAFNGEKFVQKIKTSSHSGLTGKLNYGPEGEPLKPLYLYIIKNKEAVFWKKYP